MLPKVLWDACTHELEHSIPCLQRQLPSFSVAQRWVKVDPCLNLWPGWAPIPLKGFWVENISCSLDLQTNRDTSPHTHLIFCLGKYYNIFYQFFMIRKTARRNNPGERQSIKFFMIKFSMYWGLGVRGQMNLCLSISAPLLCTFYLLSSFKVLGVWHKVLLWYKASDWGVCGFMTIFSNPC